MKRITGLDLVRIFACLCVLFAHFNASVSGFENGVFLYENSLTPNLFFDRTVYLGGIGVGLFFIVSGASFMAGYKPGSVWKFYLQKAKRIYPAFWIALAAATIFDLFYFKTIFRDNLLKLPIALAGMDGYLSVLGLMKLSQFYKVGEWFLGCLIILYLLFPLLYAMLERFPAFTCAAVLAVYVLFVRRVSEQWFFLRLPEVLIGMLFIKYGFYQKSRKNAIFLVGTAAVSILSVRLLKLKISNLTITTLTCVFLFSLLFLLSWLIRSDAVKKVLKTASALTYPVFLTHHFIIIRMCMNRDLSGMSRADVLLLFAKYLAFTLIFSYIIYYLVSGRKKRQWQK